MKSSEIDEIRKAILEHRAKMSWWERFKTDVKLRIFSYKYRWQDFKRKL